MASLRARLVHSDDQQRYERVAQRGAQFRARGVVRRMLGRRRELGEWKLRAPGSDNHWLNCLVGGAVAACCAGTPVAIADGGWRAGDYCDLWRVLGTSHGQMKLTGLAAFVREKCAVRHVWVAESGDFFQARMRACVKKTWEQWLGSRVPVLSP